MLNPLDLFTTHTYAMSLAGTIVVGIAAGVLSPVVYFRRQALLSDVMSHASLPGITCIFLLLASLGAPTRNPLILALGATTTALIAVALTGWLTKNTPLSSDSSMAISLSVTFAVGMLGLFVIDRNPIPGKAGIKDYLLGSASSITRADLWFSLLLSALVVIGFVWAFPLIRAWLFDSQFAAVTGLPVLAIHWLAMTGFSLVIINGIKVVGVILMVSFVIAPCVAARQCSNRLGMVTLIAAIIGAVSCLISVYLAVALGSIPTGPLIALVQASFAALALVFAPRRGLVWSP